MVDGVAAMCSCCVWFGDGVRRVCDVLWDVGVDVGEEQQRHLY